MRLFVFLVSSIFLVALAAEAFIAPESTILDPSPSVPSPSIPSPSVPSPSIPLPPNSTPLDSTAASAFTLSAAIPDDVFLFVAERFNPEREFLRDYWQEVFTALQQSGASEYVLELFNMLLGSQQVAEVKRLKDRAQQLIEGVDWEEFERGETAFVERFDPPISMLKGRPQPVITEMLWLVKGSAEGTAKNFAGLKAVLASICEEINRAAGSEVLSIEKRTYLGAEIASVNLLAKLPRAPALPLSVGLRGNVLIIALRAKLLDEALQLMAGQGTKRALANTEQFKDAFSKLPPAEDNMTFFSVNALLQPIRTFINAAIGASAVPDDVILNSGMNAKADTINSRAFEAGRLGNYTEALELSQAAHEADPDNSIILYNLACFNALIGNKEKAHSRLLQAIRAGFYAPGKIVGDADLESLSGPELENAIALAIELAAGVNAANIIINSSATGEVFGLLIQANQAHEEKDYKRGLKLVEQAYAIDPKDSRVLYCLACFHAVLGHAETALDFLERAVIGGYYCPQQIANDTDLDSIRSYERFEVLSKKATLLADGIRRNKDLSKQDLIKRLIDRIADAVGVIDYVATVEFTEGYSTRSESITALVSDAESRPIYSVFGKNRQMTDFYRHLPEETESFTITGGIDFKALYAFIEESFLAAGPIGEEILARWAGIQKQFGFDIHKDFIDWIDESPNRL